MVKEYSLKKYGVNHKLSEHFKLGEFKCPDGSDIVKIDSRLIEKLEELRSIGGFVITITSGYRTPAYNKKIGGATGSKHTLGQAVDCRVYKDKKLIEPKYIACLCQDLKWDGVATMNTATHLDVGGRIYRGDEKHGYGNNVGGDFYQYFKISRTTINNLKCQVESKKTDEKTDSGYIVMITKSGTNLRKSPSLDSEIEQKLKVGDRLKIIGYSGEWLQTNWNRWVHKSCTKVVSE